ncbi:MAG: YicC family protein [Deltaproteobacteria bacterium]|nr:YicC family protein [Deltaproteobacteria bacterium]
MIRSMTGYGRADFSISEDWFTVEVKSVNHRFLEVNAKLPERFSGLEVRVRDEVRRGFSRGSFYISVSSSQGKEGERLRINLPLANQYLSAMEELKKGFGLKGDVDISLLIGFKDIFSYEREGCVLERDWEGLKTGLKEALVELKRMREEEGKALLEDISTRLDISEGLLSRIEALAPIVVESYRERFKEKLSSILGDAEVDQTRLLTEVALFAERVNIEEEIVRMKSHLDRFRSMFEVETTIGRKMDFLVQEMVREVSTIASKATDAQVSHLVVDIKGEIEKIREQVQNVE